MKICKLKTLKDLPKEVIGVEERLLSETKIKVEAIKWIQDRIRKYTGFKTTWTKEQCEYFEEDFKFWMDRFNISEDDFE